MTIKLKKIRKKHVVCRKWTWLLRIWEREI